MSYDIKMHDFYSHQSILQGLNNFVQLDLVGEQKDVILGVVTPSLAPKTSITRFKFAGSDWLYDCPSSIEYSSFAGLPRIRYFVQEVYIEHEE